MTNAKIYEIFNKFLIENKIKLSNIRKEWLFDDYKRNVRKESFKKTNIILKKLKKTLMTKVN